MSEQTPEAPEATPSTPAPSAPASRPYQPRPRPAGGDERIRTIVVDGVEQTGTFADILKRFGQRSADIVSEVKFRQFHRSKKEKALRKAQRRRRKE